MNRIEQAVANQKVFVGYIVVGDGGIERSFSMAQALIAGGVNLLELGMPFSDPMADGPVIQRAAQRSLQMNTTLADVLELAKKIRNHTEIPIILFSYFNPLLAKDPRKWLPQAKRAGIDGILVVDLPWEEGKKFYQQCHAHEIFPISVITPVTSEQRLQKIIHHSKGFLYYACQKGTTGIRAELPEGFAEQLKMVKRHTVLPIVAGFGIGSASTAKEVLKYADGFVVGSLFVQANEEGKNLEEIKQLAAALGRGEWMAADPLADY